MHEQPPIHPPEEDLTDPFRDELYQDFAPQPEHEEPDAQPDEQPKGDTYDGSTPVDVDAIFNKYKPDASTEDEASPAPEAAEALSEKTPDNEVVQKAREELVATSKEDYSSGGKLPGRSAWVDHDSKYPLEEKVPVANEDYKELVRGLQTMLDTAGEVPDTAITDPSVAKIVTLRSDERKRQDKQKVKVGNALADRQWQGITRIATVTREKHGDDGQEMIRIKFSDEESIDSTGNSKLVTKLVKDRPRLDILLPVDGTAADAELTWVSQVWNPQDKHEGYQETQQGIFYKDFEGLVRSGISSEGLSEAAVVPYAERPEVISAKKSHAARILGRLAFGRAGQEALPDAHQVVYRQKRQKTSYRKAA